MMNLVGELVLTRNQILQCTPGALNFPDLARRLDSVTAELRESVMEARMQPVGHLFGKFPRMVRDLGRTCSRQVRIEFEGQETGLDKSLLEAIRDPLTHAVRNSVDHGIESPEDRIKACGRSPPPPRLPPERLGRD
jgi:two-component system chemotaxis sensor kinase CheA